MQVKSAEMRRYYPWTGKDYAPSRPPPFLAKWGRGKLGGNHPV